MNKLIKKQQEALENEDYQLAQEFEDILNSEL
jgi:hypothetical protein